MVPATGIEHSISSHKRDVSYKSGVSTANVPEGPIRRCEQNEFALVIGTNVPSSGTATLSTLFVSSKGRGQTQEREVGFEPTT